MKVLKFGGTSVQSASAMRQVFDCIHSVQGNKLVLLSAVAGVTDLLLKATKLSISNIDDAKEIIELLRKRHIDILDELCDTKNHANLHNINNLFNDILSKLSAFQTLDELTLQNIDSVQSYGELLSTKIFCKYLQSKKINFKFLDARDVMKTDSNFTKATLDYELTHRKFEDFYDFFIGSELIVTQGFIASDFKNRTTTFGRGGSDYSASLFGSFLKSVNINVDEIQIWTDVDGVLSADPRIVPTAQTVKRLLPEEVSVLSYLGAKVLHPDTIKPALTSKIPVSVFNTFNPKAGGSIIKDDLELLENEIHSIVVIGSTYELVAKTKSDQNIWDIANRINEISASGKCYPLYLSMTENQLSLVFKNNPEFFTESKLANAIKINKVYLIAITGNNMSSNVSKISSNLHFDMHIAGISENAIFIVSKNEIKNEDIISLHNKIIEIS